MSAKSIKTNTLFRSAQLNRAGLDKEKRTITVRFSTETKVRRWFGEEQLSHDPGACNLERMKNGAAVLCEHDTDKRCGITESASIVDKTGEAVVRFARTPLGDQVMGEVEDGTLRWVSVGYVVNRFEVNDKEDEYRAIDWEPLEVSFVGIPADPNAKVLRSNSAEHESTLVMKRSLLHDATAVTQGNGPAPVAAPAIISREDFTRELDEAREILTLSAQYQRTHPEVSEFAEKCLKDKTPIREFQRKIIEMVSKPSNERTTIIASAQEVRGARSIGGRFVESPQYKEGAKRRSVKGISFDLPDMYAFRADYGIQQRINFGISTSDVSGTADLGGITGAGIEIDRTWHPLNQQPLAVADLFSQGSTVGDVIRYIRELTFTNAAARVAEAAAKPQAQLDVGIVNATVEKTAVYIDVTEEMMNDWQQAASFINARLSYMVQAKEEDYLINGTGSSQITGILNTSGIQTISGATNTVDQLARAKAYVQGANGVGFASPDAILMNPLDWFNVAISRDGNGQYYFGGPSGTNYGVGGYSNVSMAWGLPVVTTTLIAQGTALVGAFRSAAQIFRRQGVTIKTTDSDGSKFLSNIMTVLAESRFALAVYQPNQFVAVTNIPSVGA